MKSEFEKYSSILLSILLFHNIFMLYLLTYCAQHQNYLLIYFSLLGSGGRRAKLT